MEDIIGSDSSTGHSFIGRRVDKVFGSRSYNSAIFSHPVVLVCELGKHVQDERNG